MNLSSLVIPVLLAGVALYGMGKRVDVYGALTHGDEEGLTVLLQVLPAPGSGSRASAPRRWSFWAFRRRPRR